MKKTLFFDLSETIIARRLKYRTGFLESLDLITFVVLIMSFMVGTTLLVLSVPTSNVNFNFLFVGILIPSVVVGVYSLVRKLLERRLTLVETPFPKKVNLELVNKLLEGTGTL